MTIRTAEPKRGTEDGASQVNTAFTTILADIVSGTYPSGARLPAERELAKRLSTSRPTIREALRRLDAWRLIETKRGSGVAVRSRTEWSIEVMPAYLRYGKPGIDEPSLIDTLADLLTLRRMILSSLVPMLAAAMPRDGTLEARIAAREAWAARGEPARFVALDFEVLRKVAQATRSLPAMWLLNRLSDIYLDLAKTFALPPPDDYLESHGAYFDALEAREGERAQGILAEYLLRHDRRFTPGAK